MFRGLRKLLALGGAPPRRLDTRFLLEDDIPIVSGIDRGVRACIESLEMTVE